MATVSTFIKNAISLASRSMSDAVATLLWGDETVPVQAIKSRSTRSQFGRGDSGVINEQQRFVVPSEGLTLPNEYEAIRVDGIRRVVTSVVDGVSSANALIGTSAPFCSAAIFAIKFDDVDLNLVHECDVSVPALRIGGDPFDSPSGTFARATDDRVKVAVTSKDWIASLTANCVNRVAYPNTGAIVTLDGESMRVVEWSWIGMTMLITLRDGRDY